MSKTPTRVHEVEVVTTVKVAPQIFVTVLRCPEVASTIQPGEFFNLWVPGDASEVLRLPFSYSSINPKEGALEFMYQVIGEGTKRLSELPKGTKSTILGPAGHGWTIPEDRSERMLLVAGGLGVAPLLPLAKELGARKIPYDVVIGAPTAARVVAVDRFKMYGASSISLSTDDGTAGYHGFCTKLSEDALSGATKKTYTKVATCGPEPMQRIVAQQAQAAGVACEVSLERGMICGFGACMSCVIKTVSGQKKGVCMAGPVFDAAEVDWSE